jgi:hypothetical protein
MLFFVYFGHRCAIFIGEEGLEGTIWGQEEINPIFPGTEGLRLSEGQKITISRSGTWFDVVIRKLSFRGIRFALSQVTGKSLTEIEIAYSQGDYHVVASQVGSGKSSS